jgi:hypothetical protein
MYKYVRQICREFHISKDTISPFPGVTGQTRHLAATLDAKPTWLHQLFLAAWVC